MCPATTRLIYTPHLPDPTKTASGYCMLLIYLSYCITGHFRKVVIPAFTGFTLKLGVPRNICIYLPVIYLHTCSPGISLGVRGSILELDVAPGFICSCFLNADYPHANLFVLGNFGDNSCPRPFLGYNLQHQIQYVVRDSHGGRRRKNHGGRSMR